MVATLTMKTELRSPLQFLDGSDWVTLEGDESGGDELFTTLDVWDDLTPDVKPSHGFDYYSGANQPLDIRSRVASPGKFTFVLDNSNGDGGVGYYSFEHSNCRAGFYMGAIVRVSWTKGAETVIDWQGRIYASQPDTASVGVRLARITAYDWLFEASQHPVKGLTVEVDQRGDQALTTALEAIPASKKPFDTDFDASKETYDYVFDSERDERTKILGICTRLAMSELGRIYDDRGTLKFTNRHHHISEDVVQYDFDDAEPGVVVSDAEYNVEKVYTVVKVKVYPRDIDDDNVDLAQLNRALAILAGDTEEITLRFRDPNGTARVSALSTVTPVEGIDYVAKTSEDGTGSTVSSDLTITVEEESANSITLSIYNSGSVTAYTGGDAGTFKVGGKGMYRFDPVTMTSEASDDLQRRYGRRELEYDATYLDNPLVGESYAEYIRSIVESPRLDVGNVMYYPEINDSLADAFLDISLGKRITVARSQVNLDDDFFVIFKRVSLVNGGRIKVTYKCEPSGGSSFFKLDSATYGVLDGSLSKLAF